MLEEHARSRREIAHKTGSLETFFGRKRDEDHIKIGDDNVNTRGEEGGGEVNGRQGKIRDVFHHSTHCDKTGISLFMQSCGFLVKFGNSSESICLY